MLTNYFKMGWRNLIRTKGYSAINIGGLATGMAITILIGLWVFDELNYNRSFINYDQIAQVYHHVTFGDQTMTIGDVPAPMGEALTTNYPEFESVAVVLSPGKHIIALENTKLSETGVFVDQPFTNMFSIRMLEGTATLKDIHSIICSRSLATSILGDNPVGKMIKFDNRDQLMVTGVFEDFPRNSEFASIKFLVPLDYYYSLGENNQKKKNSWEDYSFACYVQLKDKSLRSQVEVKMKNLLFASASNDGKALTPKGILLPMDQWHLHAEFKDGVNTGGQIRLVWMVGTIGAFVLLLAAINFMNLSTARSEKRAREVGIRKVMGSAHRQLILQFLTESVLTVTLGLSLALGLATLALPWFNNLADKSISIPWTNPVFLLAIGVFIAVTSILAGSYPALYLSSFSPVKVLKGTFRAGRLAAWPRKAMVVFQFTTSIVLIAETIIVFQQIQHAKNRPVGFDRQGIFHVEIRTHDLAKANYNSLRHELLATGVVENMAVSDFPVTGSMSGDASITWEGKDPSVKPLIAMNSCSHDFPKTNGFQFVSGRDFSRDFTSDSSGVIINELAANIISPTNVIGKKIKFGNGKEREIIGVIKDQIRWTPFVKQSPHLYYINYYYIDYGITGYLTIRLNPHMNSPEALRKVEAVIKQFDDGAPFDYKFQDEDYARLFSGEERIGKLASVFSVLAIFISCIGIFGLAAFAASQRTKEIGIRKVLGASVLSVWRMLSTDFVRLVVASILLGTPLAYYFASLWLQQYDYRVEISWVVFVVTGFSALGITMLTVSYQALKAAMVNPVNSIRTE